MSDLNEKYNTSGNIGEVVTKYKERMNESKAGHYDAIPEGDILRRETTAILLDNTEKLKESVNTTAGMETWQPLLMGIARRLAPRLISYDIMGVQAMNAPSTIMFAMTAKLANDPLKDQNDPTLPETMGLNEVEAGYSGDGVVNSGNTFAPAQPIRGTGKTTYEGETEAWNALGVSISKTQVTAVTRNLRADVSQELKEDMQHLHGLNAQTEIANYLSNEILAELNREALGKVYRAAKMGVQWKTDIATRGVLDLAADADGRWSVEKFKGLHFAIERDANAIAIESRRGKANKLIVSADIASALVAAGILDFAPALQMQANLSVDPSGATFAGRMGRYDVYVDPYAIGDGYCLGYKGVNKWDAGIFYCPYIPLQMSRAVNSNSFQDAIGFRTRYAFAANPFTTLNANQNVYYRKAQVTNLFG